MIDVIASIGRAGSSPQRSLQWRRASAIGSIRSGLVVIAPATLFAGGLAQQGAGDDEALDLRRSLVDLGDLRVAVVALGRQVARIAVAAEHLDRLAGHAPRDGRGEELGLRPLDRVRATGVLQPR